MKDVFMKYRSELPPVLEGLSMDVAPGEKIGIIGRQKSSISWYCNFFCRHFS